MWEHLTASLRFARMADDAAIIFENEHEGFAKHGVARRFAELARVQRFRIFLLA